MRWRLEGTLNGKEWRLCYAGQSLARQLDAIWPQGGVTDGTVGDADHQTRRSDHNLHDIPEYDIDIVFALDVHETVEGQGQDLVDTLVASRDSRIRYIIHEDKIYRSYSYADHHPPAWEAGEYTGSNAHLNHVHISFNKNDAWDWAGPWNLAGLGDPGNNDPMGELVANIQKALIEAGFDLGQYPPYGPDYPYGADGSWGEKTQMAFTQMAIKVYESAAIDHDHESADDVYSSIGHTHSEHASRDHTHRVEQPTQWDVITGTPI